MRKELLFIVTKRSSRVRGLRRTALFILVVFVAVHLVMIYTNRLDFLDTYRSFVSRYVPFPAIIVDNRLIYTTTIESELRSESLVQENVYRIDLAYTQAGRENARRLRSYVVDELVNYVILKEFAQRSGISVSAQEIETQLARVKDDLAVDKADLVGILRFLSGTNEGFLRKRVARDLLEQKIEEGVLMRVDGEVVYIEKRSQDERLLSRIVELKNSWNSQEGDIQQISKEYADIISSTSAPVGGEGVFVSDLPVALRVFASRASTGAVSEVLEDEQGYYLMSVTHKESGYPGSLDDLIKEQRENASIRLLVPL